MTTLDELLEAAHQHARRILIGKADEQLTPLWHLVRDDGEEVVVGTPFDPAVDRKDVSTYMRHFMSENHVVAYSFVSETWTVTKQKGDDDSRRPTERPDRREMVTAIACDRERTLSRWWNIRRDRRGRVTALTEEVEARNAPMNGIFDGLLMRDN